MVGFQIQDLVWLAVLATGIILAAAFGKSPAEAILVAQVANGLLLPIVAVFLLIAVNRRRLMGRHGNSTIVNLLGAGVVLVTVALGAYLVLGKLSILGHA